MFSDYSRSAFLHVTWAIAVTVGMVPWPTQALMLPVNNDAKVSSAKPKATGGKLPKLTVDAKQETLLSFSFAAVPEGLTSTQVGKATLRLWVNQKKGQPTDGIEFYTLGTDWDENQVTYDAATAVTGNQMSYARNLWM